MTRGAGLALILALAPGLVLGQGYRVRLDVRAQAVSYRGVTPDSVLLSETAPGPNGGRATADGYGVQCHGEVWCFYYRPGHEVTQIPVTSTATATLWGLGVPGLTVHLTARLMGDAGDGPAYAGTEPNAQLLDAFAEYARSRFTLRGGRLLLSGRLDPLGLDGAWGRVRLDRPAVELSAYGGWGLGQAAAVPVTSPALNPLDEWRPAKRQLVAGADLAWRPGAADLRAEYRREVDPELDYFVSERAALSASARPAGWLLATAGVDYNLAEGHWGSADGTVTWINRRFSLTASGRRYQPYFSLWTLWGAFSPVPYHAGQLSGRVQAASWLALRARGERYWYEDTGVTTALVAVEDDGWRFGWGATAARGRWSLDGGYSAEFGAGAAARSLEAAVTYAATAAWSVTGYGGSLERPLELRYYDAELRYAGLRGEYRPGPAWRVWADAGYYDDQRERPDAAASAWNQLRLRGGLSVSFGTNPDRVPLPPARRTR